DGSPPQCRRTKACAPGGAVHSDRPAAAGGGPGAAASHLRLALGARHRADRPVASDPRRGRLAAGGRRRGPLGCAAQAVRIAGPMTPEATNTSQSSDDGAGLVDKRASQWSLDGPDWDFMEQQKYLWNPLMDYWFRMEIEGWDHIPTPPALLI